MNTNTSPLLCYSTTSRAHLLQHNPAQQMKGRRKASLKKRKAVRNLIRIVKGRVQVRVAGFKGVQTLSASQLIKHIPVTKVRLAAKRVLKKTNAFVSKRVRKQGKKRVIKRTI